MADTRLTVKYKYQIKYGTGMTWSGPFEVTLNPKTVGDIGRVFWDYMHSSLTSPNISVAGVQILETEIQK